MNYTAAVQALLYAAGNDGTTIHVLAQAMGLDTAPVRQIVAQLKADLEADANSGLTILEHGQLLKMATKPAFLGVLQNFMVGNIGQHLSQAALEVLAISAYQQPITRIEIDAIRGVNSSGALQTLVTRQLLKEEGRKEVPGRPILYGTSDYFLDYFGLKSLAELPKLQEPAEADAENAAGVDLFFKEFQSTLADAADPNQTEDETTQGKQDET